MIDIEKLAREGNFLAFDVEGDGNPGQRPVELSFCEFGAKGFTREHYFLIDPERAMSAFAIRKHGLTDETVSGKETINDIADRIRALVTDQMLVGHSSINDVTLIANGIPDFLLLPQAILDTQRIARKLSKLGGEPVPEALSAFAALYGVYPADAPQTLQRSGLHSASTDAWLTGQVFKATMPLLPADYISRKQYAEMFSIRVSDARRTEIELKLEELKDRGLSP